jgi:hypothetical protein
MREPSRVRVSGPLEPFAGGFIAELEEAGYRPAAAAVQVRVLAHLSRWMQDKDDPRVGCASLSWSGSGGSILLGSPACAEPGWRSCWAICAG